jgi:hypothetical protein
MASVYLPQPESWWKAIKRRMSERRAAHMRRRQAAAAAIVTACWPESRPPALTIKRLPDEPSES